MNRCNWCNLKNPLYIKYHDEEWGVLNINDKYLYEMLILESFQAGLSWECILNKRDFFRKAYDNFDIDKICKYSDKKIERLLLTNIKGLFGMNGEVFINDYTLHYLKSYLPILIIALFGATPFIKTLIDKLRKNKYVNNIINILEPILIVMILFVVTSYLIDNSYNPFLYFRFSMV